MSKKRLIQFASALLITLSFALPAQARTAQLAGACASNLIAGGTMACHLVSGGGSCSTCTYWCEDGHYYNVNQCPK